MPYMNDREAGGHALTMPPGVVVFRDSLSFMGRPVIDLTGRVFGRLTVVEQVPQPAWDTGHCVKWWLCRCECGKNSRVRGHHLKAGTQSCGCLNRELVSTSCTKHGLYKSREYGIWASMIQRCCNPTAILFPRYGGKGLTVDDRWRDFANFYADMGPAPDGHSIDRIDNAKGYAPGNCQWSDAFQQNRNRSLSNWIEWGGERLTVSEWSRKLRVSRNTVKSHWKQHQSLSAIRLRGSRVPA